MHINLKFGKLCLQGQYKIHAKNHSSKRFYGWDTDSQKWKKFCPHNIHCSIPQISVPFNVFFLGGAERYRVLWCKLLRDRRISLFCKRAHLYGWRKVVSKRNRTMLWFLKKFPFNVFVHLHSATVCSYFLFKI